jgi:hypothetical protein
MSHGSLHDSIHYEHDLEEHDSWFRHDTTEPHHQEAHGATRAWGIIGFMVATLFLVLAVGLVTYYGAFEPLMRARLEAVGEGRPISLEHPSARSASVSRLNTYQWVDPAKGTVRIPMEVARRMQLEEHLALGGVRK